MKSIFICTLLLIFLESALGQGNKEDYYYEIPDNPKEYTAGNVAARVVDGLGFRYYWATEGLNSGDLAFKPSEEARTIEETIDHIVSLTQILLNAVNEKSFEGVDIEGMSYQEKRNLTLENIRMASEKLKTSSGADLAKYDMIFGSGGEFPFWNLLNGPVADAINHVGQIISIRRTNGNPYNQNISVLRGTVRG
ncbi:hypothetical protein [Ekhidna sp.]|uniref:DinB family protein n=1 Tax=Ekhidna sp. TaxID=2608089 RepID=UPI00329999F7